MDIKLTLKELEKLIKVCKTMGVSKFKYGDIEFCMGEASQPTMTPAPQARGSAKKAKAITDHTELQAQYDLVQAVAETLHVEDPSAYEAMLIQGELGEEKNH